MSKTMIVFWTVIILAILAGALVIFYVVEDQRNDVFTNMSEVRKIEYSYGKEQGKKVRNGLARKFKNADRYTFEKSNQELSNIESEINSRPSFIFYDKNNKKIYHIYIKDQRNSLSVIVIKDKNKGIEYKVKNSDLIDYIRNILMEM